MTNEDNLWFQSIPTFLNQPPRSLDSFRFNEKYIDDLFPPRSSSLIEQNEYQRIQNDYI